VGGVVLAAVVYALTGGTGISLGASGTHVSGLGRKKRDRRFSTDRAKQIATSLAPGSSATLVVMESGRAVVLEEELALLGAEVLMADIAEHPAADQEAAYATLIDRVKRTEE
jgi:hypothetical protein